MPPRCRFCSIVRTCFYGSSSISAPAATDPLRAERGRQELPSASARSVRRELARIDRAAAVSRRVTVSRPLFAQRDPPRRNIGTA